METGRPSSASISRTEAWSAQITRRLPEVLQRSGSCPALGMMPHCCAQLPSAPSISLVISYDFDLRTQLVLFTHSSSRYYLRFLILRFPMYLYVQVKLCSIQSITNIVLL